MADYTNSYLGANDPDSQGQDQGQNSNLQNELMKRATQSQQGPYEQGGIAGPDPGIPGFSGGFVSTPGPTDTTTPPATPPPAAPAEDFTKMGQYGGAMGGFNNDKFQQPWDKMSEKYQIGTVMSHFDPTKGITPEMIDALNKANIHGAKFSGNGDKLTIDNAGGYDRFGTGGTADVVKGLKSGNGTWQPWFVDDGSGAGGPGGAGGGGAVGPSAMAMMLHKRYAGQPDQYPDLQFMNGELGNPVQFGSKPTYTQNPLYQEMMKRLLFTPKT